VQDVFAGGVLVGLAIAVGIRLGSGRSGSSAATGWTPTGSSADLLDHRDAAALQRRARRGRRRGVADSWTPLSTAASHLFTWMSPGGARVWMWILVWTHLAIVLGFLDTCRTPSTCTSRRAR